MGSALETPPGGGHVGWVAHRKSASSRAPGAGRYDKQGERLLMSTLTARGAGLDGEAGAASVAAIASVFETNRSRRPNEGVGSNQGVASHQRLGGGARRDHHDRKPEASADSHGSRIGTLAFPSPPKIRRMPARYPVPHGLAVCSPKPHLFEALPLSGAC